MNTLVPIERSAQSIAEEEKAIVTVGSFVETVSKTAWNQFCDELNDFLVKYRDIIYTYILILLEYSTGERNVVGDLVRFSAVILLAFLSILMFSCTVSPYKNKARNTTTSIDNDNNENILYKDERRHHWWSFLISIYSSELTSTEESCQQQTRRSKRTRLFDIDDEYNNNNIPSEIVESLASTVTHHKPKLQNLSDFYSESSSSSPYHTWHSSPPSVHHPLWKANDFFRPPVESVSSAVGTTITTANTYPIPKQQSVSSHFKEKVLDTKPTYDYYNFSSVCNKDTNAGQGIRYSKHISSYSSLDWDAMEATDEDRFQQVWSALMTSSTSSTYQKLILPPACRRLTTLKKKSAAAKSTSSNERRVYLATKDEEDNPVMRLQNYIRQLWLLIRSILSYDYSRASSTLITWLQGIQHIQAYRRTQAPMSPADSTIPISEEDNNSPTRTTTTTSVPHKTPLDTASSLTDQSSDTSSILQAASVSLTEVIIREPSSLPSANIRNNSWTLAATDEHDCNASDANEQHFTTGEQAKHPLHVSAYTEGKLTNCPSKIEKNSTTQRYVAEEGQQLQRPIEKRRKRRDSKVDFCKNVIGSCSYPPPHSRSPSCEWEDLFETASELADVSNAEYTATEPAVSLSEVSSKLSQFFDRRSEHQTLSCNSMDTPAGLQMLSTKAIDGIDSARSLSRMETLHKQLPEQVQSDSRQQSLPYFFDTADSPKQLQQLVIDSIIPDKNGYILGEQMLLDSRNDTPLLVFVNSRSGPQQGHILIAQFRRLLNPVQVWDLADGGPEAILESFSIFSRLRILVCGGDGTVAWIISALEKLEVYNQHDDNSDLERVDSLVAVPALNTKHRKQWPPIAILPLGTGNDLARIHGWGGGYNNESLITILEQISESYASLLDRWEVTITDTKSRRKEVKNFFNYLGVGADAQAALQVHYLRESVPEWFFSRLVNKAMYGLFGAEDIIKASSVHTRKHIKLIADGVEIPLPEDSQGIILLNIDSYAGGVPLWSHGTNVTSKDTILRPTSHGSVENFGSCRRLPFRRSRSTSSIYLNDSDHPSTTYSNFKHAKPIRGGFCVDDSAVVPSREERYARVTACDSPSSCQDGTLEIVSIRGAFHLGQIKVGLSNAQRLCQCREVTIIISNKVAVQVDGEPWRQNSSTISIKRKKDRATMLHRSADDGGVEMEMSKLLDWAEERQMINSQVHSLLMKEFSRRIENKKRQHRARDKENNIMSALKKVISSSTMMKTQNFANNASTSNRWQGGVLSF